MLHRFDFRAYQDRAEDFVVDHENCALWLDPGLGKTSITLTAFARMLASCEVRRMLVVAPLRVARKVWSDEIKSWSHLDGLSISRMTGTWEEKFAALKVPADIHTINRESFAWLVAQFVDGKKLLKQWPWDLVVLDESQSFRNQESGRTKQVMRVRQLFPRCVELTGTPATRGYHNLWSQFHILDGGRRLGWSESGFLERFFDEPTRQNQYAAPVLKTGAKEEIQRIISDITLSMRARDYMDLPPVLYNPVKVPLSDAMLARYRKFARTYVLELQGQKNITAVNAAVLHGKLLQLANGAIYVDDNGNYEKLHDEKIKALLERLEEYEGKPVLIGYSFKSDLKRIGEALDRYCGKGKKWLRLRSDASFDEWATGTVDYGVLHPGSAGHGLNDVYKSGAENLIWFGLTTDLELYLQLNARLTGGHRLVGRNVVIDHLLAEGTQDEHTFAVLKARDAEQDELTSMMAGYAARGKYPSAG
jgi:SNF2 family DNA or RNA helicase